MSLERIAATLRETTGLEAGALGAGHLAEAVERLRARACMGTEAYAGLVAADARARELLIAELLVHETSFFRYAPSFRHLASLAVVRAAARPGPVRVLSVACATGQEPYSAAIALLEANLSPERVSVDAFDRSPSAIEQALVGRYGGGGTRGLDAARASRWFEDQAGTLSILPSVRALVHFETGSLLDEKRPLPRQAYDAVFCRNLLIYLTQAARRRALTILRASLAPGGVLYLGHAEIGLARAGGFAPIEGTVSYACHAGPAEAAWPAAAERHARHRRPEPETLPMRAQAPWAPVPVSSVGDVPVTAAAVPEETDVLFAAREHADAGRLLEACAILEARAARGRPVADHYHLLALLRRASGRTREADEALARALYLDPSHAGALLLAAVAAEGRGERAMASRLVARARAAVVGKG